MSSFTLSSVWHFGEGKAFQPGSFCDLHASFCLVQCSLPRPVFSAHKDVATKPFQQCRRSDGWKGWTCSLAEDGRFLAATGLRAGHAAVFQARAFIHGHVPYKWAHIHKYMPEMDGTRCTQEICVLVPYRVRMPRFLSHHSL